MKGKAHAHADADERLPATGSPTPEVADAGEASGEQAGLLGIQATAGNAAVGQLLRNAGLDGCHCGGTGGTCACEGNERDLGEGDPLDPGARDFLESRFGHDLGSVRVHTGPDAAASADALRARAYTVDRDIVFAAGAYRPSSHEGRRLIAHEIAHTLQAEGPAVAEGPVSRPGDAAERAAERAADTAVTGSPPPPLGTRAAGVVHRQAAGEDDDAGAPEPVSDVSGEGPEKEVEAMANVSLPGRTNARFSSSFRTQGVTQRRGEGGCNTVSGTLANTFTVATTVTLPPVPSGLTECQRANAQRFIDTILSPHEQQHVTAFNTYNGATSRPFSVTVCAGEDLTALVQAEHDSDLQTRQSAAQALSDALDPFNVDVDIDADCPAPAP